MISGINHVTIAVRDLERAFLFYHEVMGFTPLLRHAKGAYFLAGRDWFCLELDPRRGTSPADDDSHVAFGVNAAEFATASERLRQSGVVIWKENRSEGESLYFLDPEGHKLELHVGDWRSRIRSAKEKPWNDSFEFFDDLMSPGEELELEVIKEPLAIFRCHPGESIPAAVFASPFFSVTRTADELSVVCPEAAVPTGVKSETGWVALKVKGPLDFGLTGILAAIAKPLAEAHISIFAISTFDTDYVLVKKDKISMSIHALMLAGHRVADTEAGMSTNTDFRGSKRLDDRG